MTVTAAAAVPYRRYRAQVSLRRQIVSVSVDKLEQQSAETASRTSVETKRTTRLMLDDYVIPRQMCWWSFAE